MAETYGEFSDIVIRLDDALKEARTEWTDQTAMTFDQLNDGIKGIVKNMWGCYASSEKARNMVLNNYKENEVDRALNSLERKADSV